MGAIHFLRDTLSDIDDLRRNVSIIDEETFSVNGVTMKKLLEAFALFVQESPRFNQSEGQQVAEYLKMIMDADPEKVLLRQALEYYANDYNWPYQIQTPDGIQVCGMADEEATEIAKQALNASDSLKREILYTMVQEGSPSDIWHRKVDVRKAS